MSKSTTNERILWVDICRLLCIFSVIFLHSIFLPEGYTSPWQGVILGPSYDFTRPMAPVLVFFFLSGWLQHPGNRYFEWKKALLFFAPALLFWNGIQLLVQPDSITSWKWALFKLGILPGSSNINEPLWFLMDLMWLTLFLPLIHRIPFHVRIGGTILLFWIADGYFSRDTWGFDERVTGTVFFFAGTIAQQLSKSAVCNFFQRTAVWFVPVTLYLFFNVFLPSCLHYKLPEMMKASSIAPIVALMSFFGVSVLFSRLLPRVAGIVAGWAPAVFFLYASHWPIFTLYKRIALHYQIPAPHPYILPLIIIVFMLAGIGVWKIACKFPLRFLHNLVFLQPYPKSKTRVN